MNFFFKKIICMPGSPYPFSNDQPLAISLKTSFTPFPIVPIMLLTKFINSYLPLAK